MERLTIQEEEAMRWIWQIAPCYVKDVLAKYNEPKPPYTTLASVIKNLERKKYVKTQQRGNTYEYTPLIEESEYKRTFLNGVVQNYFENSYKEMVSFFAREQKLSAKDLEDILRMIEKGRE
ncbi:MAG: BlaI/MecI/CopY family transcriptional regulator [Massilibacteroides sp.]|nr:BlaI/MecI/CopY family transcriptional regulator [Massilibacteroides sp.]MDD3062198.1 BlaI/MecI/CopY family transcriptional regulator [Massilibacteroides sp.]MDD4114424.1 BlaI/MecI/CopY family transcriptional regulator [Massilibacteroides sp.]MDD4659716.1 BlaI/MecI/CopY family transcriptional regulator [Massilibacteroides sp.]